MTKDIKINHMKFIPTSKIPLNAMNLFQIEGNAPILNLLEKKTTATY